MEDNYNVFKVLKLERKEMIHSAMIASIIAHDKICRDEFFKMLIDSLNKDINKKSIKDPKQIEEAINNLQKTIVDNSGHSWISTEVVLTETVEKKIEETKESIKRIRGRADIWIGTNSEDSKEKYRLIIENKIGAENQDHQLRRYYRYLIGKDSNGIPRKNAGLFFLCVNGDEAKAQESAKTFDTESNGLKDEETQYAIITYNDIKEWLKVVISKVEDGNFKEVVKQYKKMVEKYLC